MPNRLNFSLTQLEYVLAVHKYGQFSIAAKHCHVTQPTLSMQIQKLEDDLGTVIFDRSKKPILLTDLGKQLIEQMQSVVLEARKISEILRVQSGGEIRGTLTLGVIPTVAPYLLPLLLPVIKKMYPGLTLRIFELQTHIIIESLHSDAIDLGILAIPLGSPKTREKSLYVEAFSVLCQRTHNMATLKKAKYETLDTDDIWLLEEGHCLRNQVMDVCARKARNETPRRFHFESGSLETLKSLVSSYGGYTLLPTLAAKNIAPNTMTIPFESPSPAREIGMIYVRDHYKRDLHGAVEFDILAAVPPELTKTKSRDMQVIPIGT